MATDDQDYAIATIGEEACEAGKIAFSGFRFGIDTPYDDKGTPARDMLAMEIGHVLAAVDFALLHKVFRREEIEHHRRVKLEKLLDPDRVDNLGRPLAPQPRPDRDMQVAWLSQDAEALVKKASALGLNPPSIPNMARIRALFRSFGRHRQTA